MAKDYYTILGVSKNASEKEIRQAYRRFARRYHPDLNPGDSDAEVRFKEINEAYQVLSDAESRKKYDQFGENWRYADRMYERQGAGAQGPFTWTYRTSRGAGPGAGFGGPDDFDLEDLLGDLFSGGGRGARGGARQATRRATYEHPVEVTLEEAAQGATRILTLTNADGSTRRLEVKVPPGVDNGSRVHIPLSGQGEVYLVVTVLPHATFQRRGRDLYTEVGVPLYDALLGREAQVPTLKGRVALTIPPETQNGRVFRLSGQGMPGLNEPNARGDLYATVKVHLPSGLSDEEKDLVRRLRGLRSVRGTS